MQFDCFDLAAGFSRSSYSLACWCREIDPPDRASFADSHGVLPFSEVTRNACRCKAYLARRKAARSSSMNTHRLPGFDAGIKPCLARQRTSSGCIFRKPAASVRVSVFTLPRAQITWAESRFLRSARDTRLAPHQPLGGLRPVLSSKLIRVSRCQSTQNECGWYQ